MYLITTADPGLVVRLSAVLAHAASWKTVILILGVLVIGLVGRWLAESQRRKTLVAVIKDAKDGTVIEQQRGRGGPAMRIKIGPGSNKPKAPDGGQ